MPKTSKKSSTQRAAVKMQAKSVRTASPKGGSKKTAKRYRATMD
ncbi:MULTISPECIES: hypothetical protein [unclassified Mesorhizobium]|nr:MULTISPECIES: hypothetical protein [unclassified Mesorhizobium]